jgi:hypothetical protein
MIHPTPRFRIARSRTPIILSLIALTIPIIFLLIPCSIPHRYSTLIALTISLLFITLHHLCLYLLSISHSYV